LVMSGTASIGSLDALHKPQMTSVKVSRAMMILFFIEKRMMELSMKVKRLKY